MKIFPRRLLPVLLRELNSSRIVVVTGMRQVGKTTLIRDVFNQIGSANKLFIDLENPINQKIFEEEDFDNIISNLENMGFDRAKKGFLFLDEIQLMPEAVRAIKYLYDHYGIKFFLTGSSSFYLKNLFPESLAGRKSIYELGPLDFEEFLVFKNKTMNFGKSFPEKSALKNKVSYETHKKLYDEYMKYGGFPAVVAEKSAEQKKRILEDVFKSYFEKDIRSLSDFKEVNKVRDMILLIASRSGSRIEIAKLSSELAVSRETVYSYLNFLEHTFFIHPVNPYSTKIDGEIRGSRKIYMCDTGLLNYVIRIDEGHVFENAVYLSLRKYGTINYYERYKGGEIDFILNKQYAFEVKVSAAETDVNRIQRLTKELKLKDCYVVTKNFSTLRKAINAQNL